MIYKEFLLSLAKAYKTYAKEEEDDVAYMCLVLGECNRTRQEQRIRKIFQEQTGNTVFCFPEYCSELLCEIDVHKKAYNCHSFYEEDLKSITKSRSDNRSFLRAKWLELIASKIV